MKKISEGFRKQLNDKSQSLGNNNNPIMSVELSRAKNTIQDSTYWTTELIRTGSNLGESVVAPRRLSQRGSPDRLYNIYIDNGIVKTAYREYPDYQELKWQDQFIVGPGNAVAMSFDGYWDLYRDNWRIVTSNKPWIFWVNNDILFAQYWDEVETKIELAYNVKKVTAIRGWRNVKITSEDQGVIVAYIKNDGSVHYRNYCEQINNNFTWEIEKKVNQFTEYAENINLFITNDYRSGFVIENSLGNIKTLITSRAWAGMAVRPEYIAAKTGNLDINLKPIIYRNRNLLEKINSSLINLDLKLLYAGVNNMVTNISNIPIDMVDPDGLVYQDWGYAIEVTFKNPLGVIFDTNNITILDVDRNIYISVYSITKINNKKYIVNIDKESRSGLNEILGDIKVEMIGLLNEIDEVYQDIQSTFTPVNLEYPEIIYPPPTVEVIWNE